MHKSFSCATKYYSILLIVRTEELAWWKPLILLFTQILCLKNFFSYKTLQLMVSQLRLPASKVLLKPEHVSKGFQRGKLGKTRQKEKRKKKMARSRQIWLDKYAQMYANNITISYLSIWIDIFFPCNSRYTKLFLSPSNFLYYLSKTSFINGGQN